MAEQPHITAQDLRTALGAGAGRAARRSKAVLPGAPDPPGWDWDSGVSHEERGELSSLRETVARQRDALDRLRRERDARDADARAAADALAALAGAPLWRRRRVLAALRERGLVG